MGSLGWALVQYDWGSCKKRKIWTQAQRKKMAISKPWRGAWKRSFLHSPQSEPGPQIPWSWTSILHETNKFLLLSHPWYFVMATLTEEYIFPQPPQPPSDEFLSLSMGRGVHSTTSCCTDGTRCYAQGLQRERRRHKGMHFVLFFS